MTGRIKPMISVNAIYERDASTYPDVIRIPMSDGHVVSYRIDEKEQHPAFTRAMEMVAVLKEHVYGGDGKQIKGRRRRIDGNI